MARVLGDDLVSIETVTTDQVDQIRMALDDWCNKTWTAKAHRLFTYNRSLLQATRILTWWRSTVVAPMKSAASLVEDPAEVTVNTRAVKSAPASEEVAAHASPTSQPEGIGQGGGSC